ncbi:hypothetical protein ACMFMG_009812 [Clarireedia jacksonii]
MPFHCYCTKYFVTTTSDLDPVRYDHSKATTAANPPSTPAPNPICFCWPASDDGADALDEEEDDPLVALPAAAEDALPFVDDEDAALPLALDVVVVAPVAATALEPELDAALALALDAHVTAEGRFVTPDVLQRFCAYCTAAAWSAGLHLSARQQAMSLRKVELEQMQTMSRVLQPPMPALEVN